MVDTSKYVVKVNDYLKPQIIEDLQRAGKPTTGIVIPGSGIEPFNNKVSENGLEHFETVQKPWVMVQVDGKDYKWTLSKTANGIIGASIGFDTDLWVGVKLQFFPDVVAGKKTIKAIVLHPVTAAQ